MSAETPREQRVREAQEFWDRYLPPIVPSLAAGDFDRPAASPAERPQGADA